MNFNRDDVIGREKTRSIDHRSEIRTNSPIDFFHLRSTHSLDIITFKSMCVHHGHIKINVAHKKNKIYRLHTVNQTVNSRDVISMRKRVCLGRLAGLSFESTSSHIGFQTPSFPDRVRLQSKIFNRMN